MSQRAGFVARSSVALCLSVSLPLSSLADKLTLDMGGEMKMATEVPHG